MQKTLLIFGCVILSSCGMVRIGNHEVCGDKGPLGATCFRLVSDDSRKLSHAEWEQERFGQLCMKAEAYANLKAALLKLCGRTKNCTFEEREQIKALGMRVNKFKMEVSTLPR